jgi:recombination protein RecA
VAKTLEKDAKKDRADGAPSTPVTREIPAAGAAGAASSGTKTNPIASGAKTNPAGAGGTAAKPAAAPPQAPRDPARESALSRAVQQIEKQFGKGSVMKLDGEQRANVDGIPTGSLSLDIALGGTGIPRGRVLEIFGPESSGKTTLCLHVIASTQKLGGVAAFIDAEHALDPSWAKRLGVRLDDLLVSQPDTGEQALEICELLVRSNAVDVIVIDSVAALIPRAEIEGEMGDSHVGLQARLMSQALRKLTGAIAKSKCTVIFINQIREKIGVMFGNPETTTGGRALKIYASLRLDIRRIGAIKDGQDQVGNRTRVKVVKNKVAPPFKQAEFDIMFNEGISHTGLLVDLGVENDIVDKSGAWFSYGDKRLGQGRENAKATLKENPEMAAEIEARVREELGIRGVASGGDDGEE